ncbi:conserved hypothetical protein [Tenacibaculum dicentrarchi]|nr:conserved hypothetical protein [Tenacibaculum dicentrarchi]
MGEYKFKGNVNKEKIFIINKSKISDRIDPDMIKYNREISHFKFPLISLGRLLIKSPQYGANEAGIERKNIKIARYIRITDINSYGLLSHKLGKTASKIEEQYFLKNNDILFARSGNTVGKSYIHKEKNINYKCFFAGYMIRFIVDTTKIIPDYLFLYTQLSPYKKWVKAIQRTAGQPNINAEEYKSLKIPLPPITIQQEIVDKYQKVYTQKQQKEKEAKDVLNSIDPYLLNELGITLPKKDNSLEGRINSNVRFRDLTGSRLDPMLYDKHTLALKDSLKKNNSTKFKTLALKKLIIKSVAGDWGIEENNNNNSEIDTHKRCLVIRATEFDNNYNLKLKNSRVKYRLIKKEKLEKIDIKANDLLIEKSGGSPNQPVGRISIITNDIINKHNICYSNFIHKIRVNDKIINPKYLFCFLKTIHNIKLTESMQSQTNGIRNLIMETYFNQTIILPIKQNGDIDLKTQNEIANHISNLRAQAKQLKEEAKSGLELVKQEIEQLILGNK